MTGLLPVLLFNVPDGQARAGVSSSHLGVDDTVGDLLRHPAFAGYAHLILPWDGRAYDERMPLTRIGSLLPYRQALVDLERVVGVDSPAALQPAGGEKWR